jgi:hypothetical protein
MQSGANLLYKKSYLSVLTVLIASLVMLSGYVIRLCYQVMLFGYVIWLCSVDSI